MVNLTHGPLTEQRDYYAFGMQNPALSTQAIKYQYKNNRYTYTSKELQSQEFVDSSGLNEYDFGARFYDPQIGRWNTEDPLSEKNRRWSTYAFTEDNSIRFIDPDGMEAETYDSYGGKMEKPFDQQTHTTYKYEGKSISAKTAQGLIHAQAQKFLNAVGAAAASGQAVAYAVASSIAVGAPQISVTTNNVGKADPPLSKEQRERLRSMLSPSTDVIALQFEMAAKATTGLITITTSKGTITLTSTAVQFEAMSEYAASLGKIATIAEATSDVIQYQNGAIGTGRLAYRMTGHTATFFSGVLADAIVGSEAGPWGTLAGIVVGMATPGGEILYDRVLEPKYQKSKNWFESNIVDPIVSMENQLRLWHP